MSSKKTCPECGRFLRTKNFRYNPVKKIKLCSICNNRVGRNKFYSPTIKGAKKPKKKYSPYFKYDEKLFIASKYDMTYQESKEKLKGIMCVMKEVRKKQNQTIKTKAKDKGKLNKKFLEGLK